VRLDWEAVYLDGRSAARQPATVRIGRTALDISLAATGARMLWRYGEIRQTQGRYAGEHVRLERGGELSEALLVRDVAFLSAVRAAAPDARLHDPARRRFRVALTLGALASAVALALGIYFVALPAAAGIVATRVPVAWEERLGAAIVEHIAPADARCEDEARQARVAAVAAAVLKPAAPTPYAFTVTVVNSDTVNAVAAPGGAVVVFRGLLERTDTAEELAGVLAHEFQHVLHRHATRAIFQQASAGVLAASIVGDASALVAFGLEGARLVADLSMSRQAEAEADRDGLRMLHEAGIDTAGTVAFFEKLARLSGGSRRGTFLNSHPAPEERLATMRALSAAWPRPATRLLPAYDWRDVKRMCDSEPPPRSPAR
jgi:predicted Zn-dependent protease